jgi:hypothetical protein
MMESISIIRISTFSFRLTNELGINGYYPDPCLNLSIQCKCANDTLTEIIRRLNLINILLKYLLNSK